MNTFNKAVNEYDNILVTGDLNIDFSNSKIRPVETGRAGGGGVCSPPPQIFAKVDLLTIDNDSDKKKTAKECKLA